MDRIKWLLNDIKSLQDQVSRQYPAYLHAPETLEDIIRTGRQLTKLQTYLAQASLPRHWLVAAQSAENRRKIHGFASALDAYKKAETSLKKIYVDPRAMLSGMEEVVKVRAGLQELPRQETVSHVVALRQDLEQETKDWKDNGALLEAAELIWQTDKVSIVQVCAVKEIAKTLSKTIYDLPRYAQNPAIFESYNRAVLTRLETQLKRILTEQAQLSNYFHINLLPPATPRFAEELISYIKALQTGGVCGFLDQTYRTAKKFYKSIARSKPSTQAMVYQLDQLLTFVNKSNAFQSDLEFTRVLGTCFNGTKTNIREILSLCSLFDQIDCLEKPYGHGVVLSLKNFLTDSKHSADFSRLQLLLSACSDFQTNLPIKDISYRQYQADLKNYQIAADCLDRHILRLTTPSVTIGELLDGLEQLGQFQNNVDALSAAQNMLKDVLAEPADMRMLDKFKNLRHYLNGISQCPCIHNKELFLQQVCDAQMDAQVYEACASNSEHIVQNMANMSDVFSLTAPDFTAETYASVPLTVLCECLQDLHDHRNAVVDTCVFSEKRRIASEQKYAPVLSYLESAHLPFHSLDKLYTYLVYYKLLNQYQDPRWQQWAKEKPADLVERIADLEKRIHQIDIRNLEIKLDQRPIKSGTTSAIVQNKTELCLIQHLIGDKGCNIPLRRLMSKAGHALQDLKPCFLMSPISVSQYIPPQEIFFDLLIIDEASQMYREEALGGIFRAKQIVIVGDNKQLPPSSFFQINNNASDVWDDSAEEVQARASILEDCAEDRGFPSRMLLWHYRSKDSSLIAFSNHEFYDDRLNIFPSPIIRQSEGAQCETGITRVFVDGQYAHNQNEAEADAVMKQVEQFVHMHPDRSFGIATVNLAQRLLLENKFDALLTENPSVQQYYEKWQNALEAPFIKNLENVQGDERDYMFISTVYGSESAPDTVRKVANRFGPINGEYGSRRLNVLFTRAKYGIMLFTSLKAEDIKITDTSSNGLKTFQRYLLYAETGRLETGHITGRDFDSEFERAVYDVLQKRGYAVDKQVGEHGFFIDLAVKHKKNNACYALGIECDGAPYHSAKSARDRDYIRQNILESLGWRIYRIWSTDWYHNQKEEIKKLEHYLETLMQQDPTVKSVSALSRTQALPFRHTSKQDMNEPITNPDMPNAIQVSEDLQIDNA